MSEPVPEFDRNIDRIRIRDTKADSPAKDSQVIEMKDWMTYDYWYTYLINLRLCETRRHDILFGRYDLFYRYDCFTYFIFPSMRLSIYFLFLSSSASSSTIINFDIDIGTGVGIVSPSSSSRRRCCRCYCCRCHRWWDLESHSSKFF